MPFKSTDLKMYSSANMPKNDTDTCGGVIDTTTRIVFNDITLPNMFNSKVRYYSDEAADNTVICIVGRDVSRVLCSQSLTLNGLNHVSGTTTFSEIILCSGNHNGSVTFDDQDTTTTFLIMESGVNCVRKPFYNLQFTNVGKTAYEKIFLKNTHFTEALQDAWIIETADPSGKLEFALASGQNDSETTTNRLTLPTTIAIDSFSSSNKAITDTHLYPGSGIGIWLKTTLDGIEGSFK